MNGLGILIAKGSISVKSFGGVQLQLRHKN